MFVDLSAAYDTVNHRRLLSKILETTKDTSLTELIESWRTNFFFFFVEPGGKKSRWCRLKRGLPHRSVLGPLLFNIYTNDQPESVETCRFIDADNLGIGAQHAEFEEVEERLSSALAELTPPTMKRTTSVQIHPRHRRVPSTSKTVKPRKKLLVNWCGTPLEHCEHPVYLCITLDR